LLLTTRWHDRLF